MMLKDHLVKLQLTYMLLKVLTNSCHIYSNYSLLLVETEEMYSYFTLHSH